MWFLRITDQSMDCSPQHKPRVLQPKRNQPHLEVWQVSVLRVFSFFGANIHINMSREHVGKFSVSAQNFSKYGTKQICLINGRVNNVMNGREGRLRTVVLTWPRRRELGAGHCANWRYFGKSCSNPSAMLFSHRSYSF